jgi:hypothetical protein
MIELERKGMTRDSVHVIDFYTSVAFRMLMLRQSHLDTDAGLVVVNNNAELTTKSEAVYNQTKVMLTITQPVVWHIEG